MLSSLARQAWQRHAANDQPDIAHAASSTPPTPANARSVGFVMPVAKHLLGGERLPREQLHRLTHDASGVDLPRADKPPRFVDGFGHTRPYYQWLTMHLCQLALRTQDQPFQFHATPPEAGAANEPTARQALPTLGRFDAVEADPALTLWMILPRFVALRGIEPLTEVMAAVDRIVDSPGPNGELHAFNEADDLLDAWWYRELVGLHALCNLALLANNQRWLSRVDDIVDYHMDNTQPDHVTTQPWAVHAFALRQQTTIFAEQQMHDATTAMHNHEGRAGILAGLLFADAAVMLGGKALGTGH